MNGVRLGRLDAVIAIALALGSFVTLALTDDMGFTRDESFYFKYSTRYQGWFSRLADGPDAAGREDTVATWSENFEHPPLLKVLFGASWRVFALKRRPVADVKEDDGRVLVRVTGLEDPDGFQPGDPIVLLGPQPVGMDAEDPSRVIGEGVVSDRTDRGAEVTMTRASADAISNICDRRPDKPDIAGCQARTDGALHVLRESSALRLPAWGFAGLLIALIYLFGAELFGRWAAMFAALAFLFVPRQFFHAHLCCFDIPVTAMVMGTLYAYWKSLRSRVWVLPTAVMWGLALLTKLNAFFIPVPLVVAWLVTPALAALPHIKALPRRRLLLWAASIGVAAAVGLVIGLAAGLATLLLCLTLIGARIALPPLPRALLWMPVVGLPMLFALWPRLWYDPARAFYDYVNFHLGHVHYLQQYYGDILVQPPFPVSFAWVMTGRTVPVVLLALFVLGTGLVYVIRRRETQVANRVFIAANLLFPILLIALPSTPIFGGVKHWFVTVAFGCMLAGVGFDWARQGLLRLLGRLASRRGVVAFSGLAFASLLLAPGAIASIKHTQHGTAYYNELGGIRGAADDRMHRQFWGYVGMYALPYINEHAPRNSQIAFHNTTWDAVTFYKRDGLLRSDLRWRRDPPPICTKSNSAFYLFHHQESFARDRLDAWRGLRTWLPVKTWSADGVPMLTLYACNR